MNILTRDGFQLFEGIAHQGVSRLLYRLEFDDGSSIKCTHDHEFEFEDDFMPVCFIEIGDVISGKIVISIEEVENEEVYDAVGVANGNHYLTNGITSHNCNIIFLDEFAFVENAAAFYTSTYPVISSGVKTKVIITSTANGIGNMYYKLWEGAMQGANEYKPFRVDWWDVPGRDEEWKRQTIANTSENQFRQEFANTFLGTANTLIDPDVLLALQAGRPIKTLYRESLRIFEEPIKANPKVPGSIDHFYIATVDVSQGRGQDCSAFSVIDVTSRPFRQVAAYHDNKISPLLFPSVLEKVGKMFNNALLVIENNGPGQVVCNSIFYDFEYENVFVESAIKAGGIGVTTTKRVKRTGTSNLKDLVEENKLIIPDAESITELSYFEEVGGSFQAANGQFDDLVMTLVLFGWFVSSMAFGEYDELDLRKILYEERLQQMDDDLIEFGHSFSGDDEGLDPQYSKLKKDLAEWNS